MFYQNKAIHSIIHDNFKIILISEKQKEIQYLQWNNISNNYNQKKNDPLLLKKYMGKKYYLLLSSWKDLLDYVWI